MSKIEMTLTDHLDQLVNDEGATKYDITSSDQIILYRERLTGILRRKRITERMILTQINGNWTRGTWTKIGS